MDLNADVGEGFGVWTLGDDDALLSVVTSANVACGFHGGDGPTMRRVCTLATERGVTVGAQVSYRDRAGFGRRFVDASYDDLRDDVLYQIGALEAFCRAAGAVLRYVKPHGALYAACSTHPAQGDAVVAATLAFDPRLAVMAAAGSAFAERAATAGLRVVREAFADRGYAPDGTLVRRGTPGALLTDPQACARQAVDVAAGSVTAVDGSRVPVEADSVCVHSDTPGAVANARAVRAALQAAGVAVEPVAWPD